MAEDAYESADDFMNAIGMSTKEQSREEQFYSHLTEGQHTRIASLRYWLIGEMERFQFILDRNVHITKPTMRDGAVVNHQLTKMEYAKILIEFFFYSNHTSWFMDLDEQRKACNMEHMVNKVTEYGDIRTVIEKDRSEKSS